MNEFLRNFVMKTILSMIDSNVAEWEIREYALGWYTKKVITEEDLVEIEEKLNERNKPVESLDEDEEEPVEETSEEIADNFAE